MGGNMQGELLKEACVTFRNDNEKPLEFSTVAETAWRYHIDTDWVLFFSGGAEVYIPRDVILTVTIAAWEGE